jgi:hypothetical protein
MSLVVICVRPLHINGSPYQLYGGPFSYDILIWNVLVCQMKRIVFEHTIDHYAQTAERRFEGNTSQSFAVIIQNET